MTGTSDPRATPSLRVGFALLLVVCALLRVAYVARTSPYPRHEDEGYLTRAAARIVRDGDPDPRFFRYPSLPIYLTASSFLVGRVLDGDPGGPVGRVMRPYYTRPVVVGCARVVFALLSVGAVAFASAAAARAFGDSRILLATPLVLALSDRFLLQSWAYLNVDVVGAFVCTGALAVFFRTLERGGIGHRALLPGLLVGAAVGSKYYLGLVGLPFALVLFGRHRAGLARHLPAIVLATVVGFLLTTPYAVLDWDAFSSELSREVEHYQSGHEGGEGEPGWSQAVYYAGQLEGEVGAGGLALGLAGLAFGLRRRASRTGLFVAFPLALFAFLCTQRVHFPRNLTTVYALFAGLAAYGFVASARVLEHPLRRWVGRGAPALAAALLFAGVAAFLPLRRALDSHRVPADSRNRAQAWIEAHAQAGTRVFVAEELQMDTSALADDYDLVEAPLAQFVGPGMRNRYAGTDPLFLLPTIEPGSRLAASYGAALRPVSVLRERARFGANGVPRMRTVMIHMGDPRLAIYDLGGGDG